MEGWKNWEGKKVYIETNKERSYSGIVKSVDSNVPIFLTLIDKFGKTVMFSISEIKLIQEESNEVFIGGLR